MCENGTKLVCNFSTLFSDNILYSEQYSKYYYLNISQFKKMYRIVDKFFGNMPRVICFPFLGPNTLDTSDFHKDIPCKSTSNSK